MGSTPAADNQPSSAFRFLPKRYPREATLLLLVAMLTVLFVITGFLTKAFHQKEAGIAQDWFVRGDAALAAGKPREARDDFRNALIFEPQNAEYQLHLAQALAAYGQPDQARGYLINLLNQSPADGQVNLELARLAARDDRIADAVHYYHGAVYGLSEDPIASLNARLELCQFLIEVGDNSQAEGELTALSANVPANAPGIHTKIGDLYVRAGGFNQGLSEFQMSLRAIPENTATLAKAGSTAYRLGDFRLAESYLSRLPEKASDTGLNPDELKVMLETSRTIIGMDPLAANLSNAERAHRTAVALGDAISRVTGCLIHLPAKGDEDLRSSLDRARAMRGSQWSERSLLENTDRIHPAIEFVFDLEEKADPVCGPPQGVDLALSLVRQTHQPTKGPSAQ